MKAACFSQRHENNAQRTGVLKGHFLFYTIHFVALCKVNSLQLAPLDSKVVEQQNYSAGPSLQSGLGPVTRTVNLENKE